MGQDTNLPQPGRPSVNRDAILQMEVARCVQNGWQVTSVSPGMAAFVSGNTPPPQQTNHVLHLLLTLVTCGLWSPIWLLIGVANSFSRPAKRHTLLVFVDEYGNVTSQQGTA